MSSMLRASTVAAVLIATTAANAADLPRRNAPPADFYRPAPLFTWTGFYAGLQAGGAIGSYTQGSNQLFGSRPAGVIGGLTLGYNYQVAPNLILGLEGDISGTSVGASNAIPFFGFSGGAQMNALFTARGRVGYTLDRAMFYVTGGLAVASLRGYINDVRGPVPFFGSQSSWQPGFTAGAGIEYALTTNISAKGEYLYTSTNNTNYFPLTRDATQLGIDFHTLRAGVNYHF